MAEKTLNMFFGLYDYCKEPKVSLSCRVGNKKFLFYPLWAGDQI